MRRGAGSEVPIGCVRRTSWPLLSRVLLLLLLPDACGALKCVWEWLWAVEDKRVGEQARDVRRHIPRLWHIPSFGSNWHLRWSSL